MNPLLYRAEARDQNEQAIFDDCYRIRGLHPPEWVIDLGARNGEFSLLARALYPKARVLAIEADSDAARRLAEYRLRGLGIDVLNAVFADGRPHQFVPHGPCSYIKPDPDGAPTVSLRQLQEAWPHDPGRTLLKVDVEGAEAYLTVEEIMSYRDFRIEIHADHSLMPVSKSGPYWAQVARQVAYTTGYWCTVTPLRFITVTGPGLTIELGHGYMMGGHS